VNLIPGKLKRKRGLRESESNKYVLRTKLENSRFTDQSRRNLVRILLVNPPYKVYYTSKTQLFLPRNLAILASCLLSADIPKKDIEIYDMPILHASLDDLKTKVVEFDPDVVGIGIHATPFIPEVSKCAKAVRQVKQNVVIVTGGIIPSIFKQTIFDIIPEIDVAFEGDSEKSFVQFIKSLDGGSQFAAKHSIIHNGELNKHVKYPLPAYDLLPLNKYRDYYSEASSFEEEFAPHLEIMRGCPYQCDFCGVERNVRWRDIDDVVEEIAYLKENGYSKLYFCDETFTLVPEKVQELCTKIIDLHSDIKWRCVTRSDSICKHPELVPLMREAGCYEIGLGIEVGSQEILDKIKKGLRIEQQVEATRLLHSHGVNVNALVILCNPKETHRDVRRTLQFVAQQLKPTTSQLFIFHPVPSTPYFDSSSAFGIDTHIKSIEDWYKWDHTGEPVSETEVFAREDMIKYYVNYNRALSTVLDPEKDSRLVDRLSSVKNIFPRKRKEVVFGWDGRRSFFYNPDYPPEVLDGNLYKNAVQITPLRYDDVPEYDGDEPLEQISDRLHYEILLHCNGDFTLEEISDIVGKMFSTGTVVSTKIIDVVLRRFEKLNIIHKLDE